MGRGGWRGGWEDKKTEMRKERLKRGVSGEMEWYVARHRPIRRHWERTATDKRPTIGRKKSRNQKDMPGAFIKDNVVLSLNRGYMLRGVRYKPHLSLFQPFKYESACECVCAFTCLWVIVASGVVVSIVGITLNLCRQLRKKYKHKCVCMYTVCTVYTLLLLNWSPQYIERMFRVGTRHLCQCRYFLRLEGRMTKARPALLMPLPT